MSSIRRTISLVLALILLIGGFSFFAYLLLLAPSWKGWTVVAAGFTGALGALWLYEDFINATPNDS